MHGVIVEALELLHATIPSTIEIRHSLLTEASVLADPTQLHQIVINLCTNAEYAMRKTGGVLVIMLDDFEVKEENVRSVSGLQVGPHVRLTVQDNGTGMSPEVLERMFDPFFTTKAKGKGTGLGLSICHGIIEQHGGAITAHSSKGKGSVFTVFLPVADQNEPDLSEGLVSSQGSV